MSRSSGDDVLKERVPRKRAASSRASVAPRKRAVRKSVQKPEFEERVEREVVEEEVERKAPTPLKARKTASRTKRNQFVIVGVIIMLGVGASAVVGYTDRGQIDVNKTIEARNERIRAGGGTPDDVTTEVIPVQNTNNTGKADGGLRGRGVGSKTITPPVETSTSTATSTDATASSTDAVASSTEAVNEETTEAESEVVEESTS